MIINRPVQFAITREDPEIERGLVEAFRMREVLLICSAGDTIHALKEKFPKLTITAFDFNPHQIAHFKHKTYSGNFESLFKSWARFFHEFIVADSLPLFTSGKDFPREVFESKYWPVSFDLHFHDSFLRAMFGEAAIQHAPKGSYPRYFQNVFEKGLKKQNFAANPFLQHIFFDRFLETPSYLANTPDVSDVELITGGIDAVSDLSRFDLIQLSNIFDWSSEAEIRSTCRRLSDEMKPGAVVLLRQINNEAPIEEFLGPKFFSDKGLGKKLVDEDRSLFYSKIVVARKLP